MEGLTQPFHFGDFGVAPVTMFHPAPDTLSTKTHLLFIPPFGVADITPYKERLDALAMADRGWLYALCFPAHLPANDRRQVKLIYGALLFLRAGSDTFKVIVCNRSAHLFVSRDERWRSGKDSVIMFHH